MSDYWKPGESCVLRGIYNKRVWSALSLLVVHDSSDETILLLLPGAQCALPEGYWRWKLERDTSQGTRWLEARSDQLTLREYSWHTKRILIFLEPDKYYSCQVFWDHETNRFLCYYINFQLPFRRSQFGFDTLDLDLDIVIDPDYSWNWKDEDDYRRGIQEGGIRGEWLQEVERSKGEVLERIEQHKHPLDGAWVDWRPQPNWKAPVLTEGWQTIFT
jgi:protein associated with RNAse G/E